MLTRRNVLIVLMSIELMLNSATLLLVAFSKMHMTEINAFGPEVAGGAQVFVLFIIMVTAAELSVGLAIIVMFYRSTKSVDINFLNRLKN